MKLTKIYAGLAVGIGSLLLAGFVACSSCTPAQAAAFVNIEEAACLAEETVASVIPPGSVQTAAQDIALVCTTVPVANIVAFIQQLLANSADVGVPAATVYKMSRHVVIAKAAKSVIGK